jgi:hypothetical protein
MACTLFIRILEDKSLKTMDTAFSSIYNDRLVPATDLFQISEQLYAKRHLIEAYVEHGLSGAKPTGLPKKLSYFNARIDSLMQKYESTYLVEKEKAGLVALKTQLKQIYVLEHSLALNHQSLTATKNAFQLASSSLSDLIKIQSNVGEELIKNTQKDILISKIYSGIQFGLAILIGVLIISIILTANVLKVKTDTFSLN